MNDPIVEPLILDLLEFGAIRERTYEEVMEAWRTSCPRLPVWEDANDRGLIATRDDGGQAIVSVTPAGGTFLINSRPHLLDRAGERFHQFV